MDINEKASLEGKLRKDIENLSKGVGKDKTRVSLIGEELNK